jgi:hypothetical protein
MGFYVGKAPVWIVSSEELTPEKINTLIDRRSEIVINTSEPTNDMIQCPLCLQWMHVDCFSGHRFHNHRSVESWWLRFLRWLAR